MIRRVRDNINKRLKSECKKFLNIGEVIATIVVSVSGEATLHFEHLNIFQLLLFPCFMLYCVIIYVFVGRLAKQLLILFLLLRVRFDAQHFLQFLFSSHYFPHELWIVQFLIFGWLFKQKKESVFNCVLVPALDELSHFRPFTTEFQVKDDQLVILIVTPKSPKLSLYILFEVGLQETHISFTALFTRSVYFNWVFLVEFQRYSFPFV